MCVFLLFEDDVFYNQSSPQPWINEELTGCQCRAYTQILLAHRKLFLGIHTSVGFLFPLWLFVVVGWLVGWFVFFCVVFSIYISFWRWWRPPVVTCFLAFPFVCVIWQRMVPLFHVDGVCARNSWPPKRKNPTFTFCPSRSNDDKTVKVSKPRELSVRGGCKTKEGFVKAINTLD